ncbi:MAG: metalloregulator ArsR/SmtB family transcription factor [Dongiaceae bacterium]
MVKYQEPVLDRTPALDRTFAALADPTRRALLARLGDEEAVSISDLARPFAISLPAVMKHLDVLSDAGLVERTKAGRIVSCRLTAGPMEQAMHWLDRYQRFWTDRLDRLAAIMEEDTCPTTAEAAPDPASPSSAGSRRRRRKSMRPGPTRR